MACFRDLIAVMATLWILNSGVDAEGASFYGSSYVTVPLQEARSTTDLNFRFRTARRDALLFLAAGRTDYCLVVLQDGALKVRINLGAGEAEVATPSAFRMDDLAWHEVRIHRKDADFTLTVDGLHSSKLKLPGRFYELNIHYGLFVGGLGDFREIFLGLWDNFRGCIQQLLYNGQDLLAQLKNNKQGEAVDVTWDCSSEFEATSTQDISFRQSDSYVTFASAMSKTGSLIKFQLKTQTREGIVLYNTGPPAKPDFVAVELVEGHVRVSMDHGTGVIDVFSDISVNDGLWHKAELRLTANSVDLSIDGRSSNSIRSSTTDSSKYLELSGQIYLGGIDRNRHARAFNQGIRAANSSIRGCLRSLELDGRLLGLREARVTRHVASDCIWDYPCIRNPCADGAQCMQQGTDSFRCDCPQQLDSCTKPEFRPNGVTVSSDLDLGASGAGAANSLQILNLSPVQVSEGGSMTLTSRHIHVELDNEKYGVRESGVVFHVVRPPQYGRLFSSLWQRVDEATFTLLDVHSDRVRYIHDGSETTHDTVLLELELAPSDGFLLPSYLQKRRRFVLDVVVNPLNDPPQLTVAPGKVLRLVKNTRQVLSDQLLTVFDPDNSPSDLVYSVLNSNAPTDMEGIVVNSMHPSVSITSFTQEEINAGHIWFVHRGSPNGRLALRVSDGVETGATAVLRISAFDLQIFLTNNSALTVPTNGSAILQKFNLAFTTNAPDQDLEITYEVARPPQYGGIQQWKSNRWQNATSFTSTQLQQEHIRYFHQHGHPNEDDFQFTVSVSEAQFRSPISYQFRIEFLDPSITMQRNEGLRMTSPQSIIGASILQCATSPYVTKDENLVYTILQPPLFGSLRIRLCEDTKWTNLQAGSKFTQDVIVCDGLQYRLQRRTLSPITDRFSFMVSTEFLTSPHHYFSVGYILANSSLLSTTESFVTNDIVVDEGASSVIFSRQLNVLGTGDISNYSLLQHPRYGRIDLLDANKNQVELTAIDSFTSENIAEERVVYVHDDSESTQDHFEFLVRPGHAGFGDSNKDFQYVGRMNVTVRMKNDNPPIQIINRVFHVVTNQERKLAGNILKYTDPDVNTKSSDIIYTRQGVPNGALFHTDRPDVQIFQFTQADVDQGKILFRHQGIASSRMALRITDGQLHTTGTLEVQATDPFLERVNRTVLIVRRGSPPAQIEVHHIGIDSNLDFTERELSFRLLENPQHGSLLLDGAPIPQSGFRLTDLLRGTLAYLQSNTTSTRDFFKFRASLRNIVLDDLLDIRILPESYWQPLSVVALRGVTAEESTSVTIDRTSMTVSQPGVDVKDIVYIVRQPPQYGYLEVDQDSADYEDDTAAVAVSAGGRSHPPEINVFDQTIIDENRLHYIQSGANHTSDYFVFDVTNGVVTLTNLTFEISIIPKSIYLLTREVQVLEGGHVTLSVTDIRIMTDYYVDRVDAFLITKMPLHGSIRIRNVPDDHRLTQFTLTQLIDKQIVYWHDGSENPLDVIEIVAVAGNKESKPTAINIMVRPVDDELPVLVNNTGLIVWEGATTLLDANQLGASDVDTPAESIIFNFEKGQCGYLTLGLNSEEIVTTVTQRQIQDGHVAFVHQGKMNCSLDFTVSDGQSLATQHKLFIGARKMKLMLIRNIRLHVFPMMQQSITSSQLLAISSDYQSRRSISYQVVQLPRLGQLLLEQPDGSTKRVSSFTQRDLNQSLVIYEHTEPFADLTVNDSFIFHIDSDLTEPLGHIQFDIEISVATMAEGGLDRYLGLADLETEEGGVSTIQEQNFNLTGITHLISDYQGMLALETPKLRLVLSQTPEHGFMSVNGKELDAGDDIPVEDIMSGAVAYHHDHSDTVNDQIGLRVFLKRNQDIEYRPDILLYNGTLRISILPVNDQIFNLVTKAPAMQVVQRQSRYITNDVLLTEDADTSPKDLIYEIIQPPHHGMVSLTDDMTTAVLRFSQEDVNRQRVIYLHDGTMESTSFYFRVSDGHFKAVTGVFSLHFVALTLRLANHSTIAIQQSHTTTVISNSSMGADSNGQRKHTFYNVTQEPRYGRLYINDVAVTTFGQSNVDKEELLYVQFNMSASSDSFSVTVWNMDVILTDQLFNVSVIPLVEMEASGPIRAVVGEKTSITSKILDASKLAALSNSNPTFSILRKPRYGKIRKIVPSTKRSKRQAKEKDTYIFTHEDVVNRFIFYVPRKMDLNESVIDSCQYRLTAPNVQPAIGMLHFVLLPSGTLVAASKNSIDVAQTPGTSQPIVPIRPDIILENTLSTLGISIDIVLIVAIVCGVLLLGLVVLFIVRCRMKPPAHKHSQAESNATHDDMQLYRLTGNSKNGHQQQQQQQQQKNFSDFQVTDAYRIPTNLNQPGEFDSDSDPEPPPPPQLDYIDPPLSPRPSRTKRLASPISAASSTISSLQGRPRGSWTHDALRETPSSLPQCKIIPLNPLLSGSESETSELVNARYPYGIADESMDEWAMLDPDVRTYSSSRTTNPMLRKNQYWV